eukprot:jgi/Chlat1/7425/Chrsp6S07447
MDEMEPAARQGGSGEAEVLHAEPWHPTIDGEAGVSDEEAMPLARKNIPPTLLHVRRCAMGAAVSAAVLVPWALTFLLGGEALLGRELWRALSLTGGAPGHAAEAALNT